MKTRTFAWLCFLNLVAMVFLAADVYESVFGFIGLILITIADQIVCAIKARGTE